MKKSVTVALAGNPNSGKTTIYNGLTGARQHIGNYPGVTVERKEGSLRFEGIDMKIVDLPGTYSLTAYSAEELVARNFIIEERPDVVADVIDSSNLERNLYLAVQLMELNVPLVLVFNMSDVAKEMGIRFDLDKLSRFFGAPIVEAVGSRGEGLEDILSAVLKTVSAGRPSHPVINYGPAVEKAVALVENSLKTRGRDIEGYSSRWLAVKLLEGDKEITALVNSPEVMEAVKTGSRDIEKLLGEPPETAIASARYGFISRACQEAVKSGTESRGTLSDAIDAVVVNRVLGIPIFLGLMYLVFQLTFTLGDPFMGLIESFFGWLGGAVSGFWPEGSESLLRSLLVDGIIGGVGGVVVFLPNIIFLFMGIAILEASGYMARVAFIMDKLMRKIGLHGKSFIPFIIGFGCSVPAIMATRTLDNQRDRNLTMLVTPFMSCGARFPIYALIIPAFFPQVWNAPMLFIIYLTGILMAILVTKILSVTALKGESSPFVMELPPYRAPTVKGVLIQMWERSWLYLKKAGTIILAISILMWALSAFPRFPETAKETYNAERAAIEAGAESEEAKSEALNGVDNREIEAALEYSFAGRMGKFIEPAIAPLGFDWKIGTALIGSFAAKEVFVSQLGIVYSVGGADENSGTLREKLAAAYTPLVAFCMMIFALLSAPCMATFAVTKRESGTWKWAVFQLLMMTATAYVFTLLVFQTGRLLGIGV